MIATPPFDSGISIDEMRGEAQRTGCDGIRPVGERPPARRAKVKTNLNRHAPMLAAIGVGVNSGGEGA